MTLVLMAACDDYVVQLSDRRITSLTAGRDHAESNKGSIILLPDARLAVGYAGLARAATFVTQDWILEEFVRISEGKPALAVVDAFVEGAELAFESDRRLVGVNQPQRCVSFAVSGFAWLDGKPMFISTLASNFQDWQTKRDRPSAQRKFFQHNTIERTDSPGRMAYVQRIGRWRALPAAIVEAELKPLLADRKPARAVIDVGVKLIRQAAESHDDVGRDVTAIVLPRDPQSPPYGEFHAASVQKSVFLPDTVDALGSPAVAMKDAEVRVTSPSGPPLTVPKVGRNHPCPCGSGDKYKRCHGQRRPASPPLTVERDS